MNHDKETEIFNNIFNNIDHRFLTIQHAQLS